ncbi:putative membrane protein [Streptococcus pneumoniae GA16833]|nr:putative membrane protein [Streptococcus pneumoniae GA16833]
MIKTFLSALSVILFVIPIIAYSFFHLLILIFGYLPDLSWHRFMPSP